MIDISVSVAAKRIVYGNSQPLATPAPLILFPVIRLLIKLQDLASIKIKFTPRVKYVKLHSMQTILLKWLINALALYVTSYLVKGIEVSSAWALLLAAALLGILNAVIRPILIILTLPINILTLGLFTLIINGMMLWMVAFFIKGFVIQGFWPALLGALLISIISWIVNWLIH